MDKAYQSADYQVRIWILSGFAKMLVWCFGKIFQKDNEILMFFPNTCITIKDNLRCCKRWLTHSFKATDDEPVFLPWWWVKLDQVALAIFSYVHLETAIKREK